jgi:hypothetical protein
MASPTSPNTPQSATLPTRSSTLDPDEAIPEEDASETTKLFHERLQAWKHACGYLEDYIMQTEKLHTHTSKEYEKVLKTVNSPLKEGHHFHQQNGGVAGMFDNIRSNTQGLANSHSETAKTLKGSVLPTFERLHGEIKNKTKELSKGAGKASKAVDKARNSSQKHIELLGTNTSSFDSRGGNVKATEDPYIIQRGVYHRLNKQVIEENNNRDDMIAVQNNFSQFEAHVIQTFQQGLEQFNQVVSNQAEQTRNMYGDITANAQRMTPDFEWQGFIQRNSSTLIDPNAPKRSVENISFANQDHPSTRPLIAGSLERQGTMLKRYDAGYYVVTPSRYLHEFKSDDDFAKDPSPENSLYLPDCLIGAVDGVKFNIKGKDSSKGLMNKVSMSHEYKFKAHTPQDAKKWHDVIYSVSGGETGELSSSTPSSPAMANDQSTMSPTTPNSATTATTGTTDTLEKGTFEKTSSPLTSSEPNSAAPVSATSEKPAEHPPL